MSPPPDGFERTLTGAPPVKPPDRVITAVGDDDGEKNLPFRLAYALDLTADRPVVLLTVGGETFKLSPANARHVGAGLIDAAGAALVAARYATYQRTEHGYTDTHLVEMFAMTGGAQDVNPGGPKP